MRQPGLGRTSATWLSAILLGLAGLTPILVLLNVWLVLGDQSRQAEVNRRQEFINQSIRLSRINEGLIRALATASVNTKDDKLRQVLTEQGINFSFTPNAAAPTGAAQVPAAGSTLLTPSPAAAPADAAASKK